MARASWTWMVYVATNNAKNDVSAFGTASINQMRQAGANERVRVLVQQATPQGCQRLDLGSGQATSMGAVDSGDPATLLECIRWAATAALPISYGQTLPFRFRHTTPQPILRSTRAGASSWRRTTRRQPSSAMPKGVAKLLASGF